MSNEGTFSRGFALLVGALLGPGAGHFAVGKVERGAVFAGLGVIALGTAALVLRPLARMHGLEPTAIAISSSFVLLSLVSEIDLARIDPADFSRQGRLWLFLHGGVVMVLLLAIPLAVRAYVLDLYQVPSTSMVPTLIPGDQFVMERAAYAPLQVPARGDIVVFRSPESTAELLVKRVIGLPGEIITVAYDHVRVNGVPLRSCLVGQARIGEQEVTLGVEWIDQRPHLLSRRSPNAFPANPKAPTQPASSSTSVDYLVREGEVFVMGDNRDDSHDSRFFLGHGSGVPLRSIQGRAYRIVSSKTHGQTLGLVDTVELPKDAVSLEPQLRACLR